MQTDNAGDSGDSWGEFWGLEKRYVNACRAAIIIVLFDELDEIYNSGFRGLEVSGDDFGGRTKVGATAWKSSRI